MQNLLHVVLEFHGSYFVDQFGTRQSFCVYCIFFSSSLRTKSCCRSPFPMSVGKISICLKKTNKLLNINGIINIISTKIQVTNYPSYVWTKGSVLITVTLWNVISLKQKLIVYRWHSHVLNSSVALCCSSECGLWTWRRIISMLQSSFVT